MPLVYAGPDTSPPPTPARERARKINPVYAQGEPVKVAFTRNQAESDLIQNILLEEGIPSIARRTRGFDVPDFLAAGPRDVLVPESGAELARELLRDANVAETVEPRQPVTNAARHLLLRVLVVACGAFIAALVAWELSGGGT
jgi:hypothetical protein